MVNDVPLDAAACERLASLTAAGDRAACNELVELLWPHWVRIVRASKSLQRLGPTGDHVNEIVARMVAKLSRADGRGLRLYAPWRERNADKTFIDWNHIVIANVVRDYVREHISHGESGELSVKRLLNEISASRFSKTSGSARLSRPRRLSVRFSLSRRIRCPSPKRALSLFGSRG